MKKKELLEIIKEDIKLERDLFVCVWSVPHSYEKSIEERKIPSDQANEYSSNHNKSKYQYSFWF